MIQIYDLYLNFVIYPSYNLILKASKRSGRPNKTSTKRISRAHLGPIEAEQSTEQLITSSEENHIKKHLFILKYLYFFQMI